MTNRELQLKPPSRRDVSGFEVEPGERDDRLAADVVEHVEPREPATEAKVVDQRQPQQQSRRKPKTVQKKRDVKDQSGSRTRIHSTVTPGVGQALRDRTKATGESNTDVLIGAFVDHIEQVRADRGEAVDEKLVQAGFAPRSRRRRIGRMEVTFFLAPDEVAIFDKEVEALAFGSRSELFDVLLERELTVATAP